MKKTNILHCERIVVLPYQIGLWVVVARNLIDARNKLFPECKNLADQTEKVGQWVDTDTGRGVIFKAGESLTHGTIFHETLHATHRIMEWSGDKFSVEHQEPYAWLGDWLTDQIYSQLKKARIRVR